MRPVIREYKQPITGKAMVVVRCGCGDECHMERCRIRPGYRETCRSCFNQKNRKLEVRPGERYGQRKVITTFVARKAGHPRHYAVVQCRCGRLAVVRQTDLTNGSGACKKCSHI